MEAKLCPTAENTYRIAGGDFAHALAEAQHQQEAGEVERACNTRLAAVQRLMELLPDDEVVEMDWEDDATREAMVLVDLSAIDHFLAADWEMCAAMWETLLDLDPEDHLGASRRLAYAYVALGEWELFDETLGDIPDRSVDRTLLSLWSGWRRNGRLDEGELRRFAGRFGAYMNEFTADRHPVDDAYVRDIEAPRPAPEALARELWLQTEHIWALFPDFIPALRAAAK
jgi:hypothetical protein